MLSLLFHACLLKTITTTMTTTAAVAAVVAAAGVITCHGPHMRRCRGHNGRSLPIVRRSATAARGIQTAGLQAHKLGARAAQR